MPRRPLLRLLAWQDDGITRTRLITAGRFASRHGHNSARQYGEANESGITARFHDITPRASGTAEAGGVSIQSNRERGGGASVNCS